MARAVVDRAKDGSPGKVPMERKPGLVSGFWWAVRDACSEIKEELRLIIG
jgi:hypothetical protein